MTTTATLKAVLVDIDGTLIDSNELHVKAWSQAFGESGHQIGLDDIRTQIGKGGDKLVPALLPDADEHEQQRIADRHGVIFKDCYLNRAEPFPRAADLLRRIHADGIKIVLASSAKQAEVDHYVDLLGIADIIQASTSIDDVDRSKPDPDIFAAALDKASVEADEALVIGDTIWDVEAAKRVGSSAIALLSGGVPLHALERAGALAIFDEVADILAHYDRSPLAVRQQQQVGA